VHILMPQQLVETASKEAPGNPIKDGKPTGQA